VRQARLRIADDGHVDGAVDLEDALLGFRPHRLVADIPSELRGWILEIDWDRHLLWRIRRFPTPVLTSDLGWHLDLPWWRGENSQWFQVRPRDVLANPVAFPEHHNRIAQADLRRPIHIIRRRGRWLILDGIHRAAKAELKHLDRINAIVVQPTDLGAFAIP
jgi:hypothetical protein